MAGLLRRPDGVEPLSHPTWRWWEATLVFVLGYLAGDALRSPFGGGSPTGHEAGIVVVETTWTAVLLVWLRAFHPGWGRAMGWPARPWAEAREGAVFGCILYGVVALAVVLPLTRVIQAATGEVPLQQPVESGWPATASAVAFFGALVVAPVAEELFFRGVLFRALRARAGVAVAVAGSTAAFGFVHFTPASPLTWVVPVVVAVCLGAGLAVLYERRANLLAPLAAHVAFNAVGVIVILTRM